MMQSIGSRLALPATLALLAVAACSKAPPPPVGVVAVAGDTQAIVSWIAPDENGGEPITGYMVTSSPGKLTAAVKAPSTSATVQGLTNGTSYTFTVAATNKVGTGTASLPSNPVEPTSIPGAPTAVAAAPGDRQAIVSWQAPADEGGRTVILYSVVASPGELTTTVAAPSTSAVVLGLTNGTSYTFTVTATNAVGTSAPSASSAAVTPARVPGEPTRVVGIRGNTEATVSWFAPEDDGGSPLTGFTVTASPGGASATVDAGTTSATLSRLTNGTSYAFTVVATNAIGDSAPSWISNSVTPATVPGAPTEVVAAPGNAEATVSWVPPTDNGGIPVTSYIVTSDPGAHSAAVAAPATSATVGGLANGTSYTFTVVAANDVGASPASGPSAAVTPARVPDAPLQVSATRADAQATVSWTTPADDGGSPVTGFKIVGSPGNLTVSAEAVATSSTLTGLTNGTTYTFQVIATNAIGDSAASAPSNPVTPFEITAVAAGGVSTCAVVSGGAWCWGYGAFGQLGNGSVANSVVPVPVSGLSTGVQKIAASSNHACALRGDGVWCWGGNSSGELGNGSTTQSSVPVKVAVPAGVDAIATGGDDTCIAVNGSAECWGSNSYGQLGNNSTANSSLPVQVSGLGGVTAIAAGGTFSCAVASNGVWCWGRIYNSSNLVPTPVSGLTSGALAVTAGYEHACALMTNGVWCWGSDSNGQLGNGSTSSATPVQVSGLPAGVRSVVAGWNHTCATNGDDVWCWGASVANGMAVDSNVAVKVSGLSGGIVDLAGGFSHTCAVVGNSVQCWGSNQYQQLGQVSLVQSLAPLEVDDSVW